MLYLLITKQGRELATWRGQEIPSEIKKLAAQIKRQGGRVVKSLNHMN